MSIEGRMSPILVVGGDDIGVTHQRKRRTTARSLDARDEVRALGIAGHELAIDARTLEIALQEGRGRSFVTRWVRGVDPDEGTENFRYLLTDRVVVQWSHSDQPYRFGRLLRRTRGESSVAFEQCSKSPQVARDRPLYRGAKKRSSHRVETAAVPFDVNAGPCPRVDVFE